MNEQINQLLLSVPWNRLLRCTIVLIYLLSKVSACLKFKLLESFNLSVFGPHVKFQPTSNESLIKQTRNSMWNDCQFPRGRMWIWRPEDATLTELRAPKRSLCLAFAQRKTRCPSPTPPKNQQLSSESHQAFPLCLSFESWAAILSALLGWFLNLRDMAIEDLALLQKYLQAEKAKETAQFPFPSLF